MTPSPSTLRLIGGPTALISYGGLRVLTDPTFDPPGEHPRPGTNIVLRKLVGPAIPLADVLPVDVVLVSHDHHADNLDPAGRAMLAQAGRVLTTRAGAERLEAGNATGLEPGDVVQVASGGDADGRAGAGAGAGPGAGDHAITVTAVRADHGPPQIAAKNGPVIGFVLRGEGLPTVYISGDNASVDVVRGIVAEHAPIDTAVLSVGGAQVPEAWGDAFLTLTAETAVEAATVLGDAPVVPIHEDGWAHFTSNADDVRRAFATAGLSERLRMVAPGEAVSLDP
jgi:L-ascorbate metabolism protein UlaG (beta-lactamase superfamily)